MARLVAITPNAEATMAYIARVSNPAGQTAPHDKLLKYCVAHHHWSVFEQASMTIEIETTRAISAQLLRHRSFTFQEFSQRYSDATILPPISPPALRRQDTKNRQNSIDDVPDEVKEYLLPEIQKHFDDAVHLYQKLLALGIAKECARFVLPLATPTKLYMTGTIRSWIHYIDLRTGHGTQAEHAEIAGQCRAIFVEQLPAVSVALGWVPAALIE